MNLTLLERLATAHGTSGREQAIAAIVAPELESMCDSVTRDPLGTLVGMRAGESDDAPLLLLAAHMDEIGLMVTHVDDNGFLRVIPIGGWDARTLVSQTVVVHGRTDIPGVVGTPPVHVLSASQRAKAPTVEDLMVDVGLDAEAARTLVRPGDTITRDRPFARLGDLVTGKSLDDRVGVFVMLEAVRAAGPSAFRLAAAATVQEEVGLRGAKPLTRRLDPQVGIAIDTCPSGDGPGMKGGGTRLGKGAAIRMMDASAIGDRRLVELMEAIAIEHNIPYQFHASGKGGTDTQSLQLSGTGSAAGCISIPQRYGHSSVEVVHPDDIAAAVALLAAVIEEIDRLPMAS